MYTTQQSLIAVLIVLLADDVPCCHLLSVRIWCSCCNRGAKRWITYHTLSSSSTFMCRHMLGDQCPTTTCNRHIPPCGGGSERTSTCNRGVISATDSCWQITPQLLKAAGELPQERETQAETQRRKDTWERKETKQSWAATPVETAGHFVFSLI